MKRKIITAATYFGVILFVSGVNAATQPVDTIECGRDIHHHGHTDANMNFNLVKAALFIRISGLI